MANQVEITAIDLFCGAGGSSWGARRAGAKIVAGFDAWDLAGEVYRDNFPEARFHEDRIEQVSDAEILSLGDIDLILASPECTNHSPAKGAKPRCEKSRETAFQVVRFAKLLTPRWIIIENVTSMRKWNRFDELIRGFKELGYNVDSLVVDASQFGVPQRRKRLFILCDLESQPQAISPPRKAIKSAASILDRNGTYSYSALRSPKRARATLERAERGIASLGKDSPFLVVYYGSDHAGGWQSLDVPLRTITTLDRFALVKPAKQGHLMRMLQVPELKAAMGMPKKFRLQYGTRRNKIRMIGNAVCPPVMQSLVSALISHG